MFQRTKPELSSVFIASMQALFWGRSGQPHMAPAFGMQMRLLLLGLSSGLQLGRRRYVGRGKHLAAVGAGERPSLQSLISLQMCSDSSNPERRKPRNPFKSKRIKRKQVTLCTNNFVYPQTP